jgi:hypothetical protein
MSPEYRRAVAQSLAAMHEIDSARRRLTRVVDDQSAPITSEQREVLTAAQSQLEAVSASVGRAFLMPPAAAPEPPPASAE